MRFAANSGGGRIVFPKVDRNKVKALPNGKSYGRILPWNPKDTDAPPIMTVGRHFNVGGQCVPCLDVHADKGTCPVCKVIAKKRGTMSKDDFQEWVKPIRLSLKYAAWMFNPETKQTQLVELSNGIGRDITERFYDTEEGGVWWDPESKYDFRFTREGSGMLTEYKVEKSTKFVKSTSPKDKLADLEELYQIDGEPEEWAAYIKKLLDTTEADGSVDYEEEESEDAEEAPAKKASASKKGKKEEESEEAEEEEESEDASEEASEDAEEEESEDGEEEESEDAEEKSDDAEEESEDAEEESEESEEAEEDSDDAEEESEEAEEEDSEDAEEEDDSEDAEEEDDEDEKPKPAAKGKGGTAASKARVAALKAKLKTKKK